MRVGTINIGGKAKLIGLNGVLKVEQRRVVTYKSNSGSVTVLGRIKFKITVTGTRRGIGTMTSCVARDGGSRKTTGTVRGFILGQKKRLY